MSRGLEAARDTALTIAILVSVANFAQLVASGAVGALRTARLGRVLAAGALVAGMGTAGVGLLAHEAVLAAIALALARSGIGAGASSTIGPAVACDAVHPQERGVAAIGASGRPLCLSLRSAPPRS